MAVAFACAVGAATQPAAPAATDTTDVTFVVASQTSLVPTLCATGQAGRTDFGTVLPDTKTVTSADCRVAFGSSNDSARLLLTQTDREDEALWGGESTGAPDAGFDGGDGWRVHSLVAGSSERYFDAVAQDGRRMIAIGSQFVGADGEEFTITRYLPDGSVDTTFGTSGNTRFALGGADYGTAVDVAPDGTIVVAGHRADQILLGRLSADGVPVASWGTSGRVQHDMVAGAEEPLDIRVLTDGSIVAAGWTSGANADAYVAKFLPTGALDTSFGVGGIRTVDVQGGVDVAWRMAVQADGKVLVAGRASNAANTEMDMFVARVTATGAIDTTFGGGDGSYVYDSGPADEGDYGSGLAIQDSGRILLGGSRPGNGVDMIVVGLTPSGTVDTTFGTNGIVTRDQGNSSEQASDIDVLPNGDIAVLGTRTGSSSDVHFWRLRPNGSFDTDFSGDGFAFLSVSGASYADLREQVIGPDGSVMFAGFAGMAEQDYLVGRLASTTVPDYAAGRWGTPAPLFGACLRDAVSATATWTEDPDATCTAVDSDPWKAIARVETDPTAEIARTAATVTNATVDLRFGVYLAPSQRPGRLVAPLTFTVVAP